MFNRKWLLCSALSVISANRAFATITVLPLGDSITAGYNGVVADAGYRQDLLGDLTAQNVPIQYVGVYDPTPLGSSQAGYSPTLTAEGQNMIAGFSGYTSATILQNLNGIGYPTYNSQAPSPMGGYWMTGGNGTGRSALDPNIVLLMIGTNDLFFGESFGNLQTPGTTEYSINGILSWFSTNLPNTKVIVASPPLTTSVNNSTIQSEESWLPGFVAANYPNDLEVNMVPAVPASDINTNDGVHPTDQGYAAIASVWDSAVTSLVSSARSGTAIHYSGSVGLAGSFNHWSGQIDLADNDAIVTDGDLATITNQIASGYSGGTWKGNGIISSAASAQVSHLTTLGVIQNANASGAPIYSTFDGQTSTAADVLVKYTYYGDANLDGKVDGSDYSLIDNGYLSQSTAHPLSGWSNGDFNYDGAIDGSDYTLIDNAFDAQGANLSASVSTQIALVPEPAGLLVLAAGLLALRRRRKA